MQERGCPCSLRPSRFGLSGCGGSSSSASKDTLRVGATNFMTGLEPTANYFGWQVVRYGVGEALVTLMIKCARNPGSLKAGWSLRTRCPGHSRSRISNSPTAILSPVKLSRNPSRERLLKRRSFRLCSHSTISQLMDRLSRFTPRSRLQHFQACWGRPLFIIVDTSAEGKQDFDKQGPISTGPYVVKSFSKAKTELDANPNYYAAVPYKHAVVNTIDDPSTQRHGSPEGRSRRCRQLIAPGDLALFKDKNNSPPLKSIPSATFLPVFP